MCFIIMCNSIDFLFMNDSILLSFLNNFFNKKKNENYDTSQQENSLIASKFFVAISFILLQ